MPVELKTQDAVAIRKMIPLTTLSSSRFESVCAEIQVEEAQKGAALFKQGDYTSQFVYLISGEVSLQADEVEMDSIAGGDESARFALAHQLPRKVSAIAKNNVRFVRINSDLLNVPDDEKQEAKSYEVSDVQSDSEGDWMGTLLSSPVFQRLPAANLQKVLRDLEEISVTAGSEIIQQGEPGDYYYIIKKGRCALSRKPSANAKDIRLAELKTCDTFGEDALISGEPRNVNVTMLTDGVLLRLDKETFLSLAKEPVLKKLAYAAAKEEEKNGAVFLDVRSLTAYRTQHLKNSVNQPFFSLRMHVNGLARDNLHILVCDDGKLSEAAAFLLIRHGIDAVVLEGGLKQVPSEYLEVSKVDTLFPGVAHAEKPKQVAAGGATLAVVSQAAPYQKTRGPDGQRESLDRSKQKGSDDELERLRGEIAKLSRQSNDKDEKLNELRELLSKQKTELSDQQAERGADSSTASQGQNFADDPSQRISHLEKLHAESKQQIEENENTIKSLRDAFKTLSCEKQELENAIAELKPRFDEATNKNSRLHSDVESARSESKNQLLHLNSELEKALKKQESLESRLSGANMERQQSEAALQSLNHEHKMLEQKLEEKLNEQEVKISTLLREKEILEQQLDELRSEDPEQCRDLDQVAELRKEVTLLQGINKDTENKMKLAQKQVVELTGQTDELNAVVQEFLNQKKSDEENLDIQSLKAELELVRTQANNDVATIRSELDRARRHSDELEKVLQRGKNNSADSGNDTSPSLSFNPDLTPVDKDIFEDAKTTEVVAERPQPVAEPASETRSASTLTVIFFTALVCFAAIAGITLGTEKGRQLVRPYIFSASDESYQAKARLTPPSATSAGPDESAPTEDPSTLEIEMDSEEIPKSEKSARQEASDSQPKTDVSDNLPDNSAENSLNPESEAPETDELDVTGDDELFD